MDDVRLISVLSDSHGLFSDKILHLVRGSDMIIHAGDIMSVELIRELKNISKYSYLVCGNNDRVEFYKDKEERDIIGSLNRVEKIHLPSGTITVTHGDQFGSKPSHSVLRSEYSDSKLIIYGHTHYQIVDDGLEPWVINPGASGSVRNMNGGPAFVQIDIKNSHWKVKTHCFI